MSGSNPPPEPAAGRPTAGGPTAGGPAGSTPGDDTLAAVVLAGGAARRLGGAAKPLRTVGGRLLLLRVLDAVAGHPVVVVGPAALAPLLPAGAELVQEEPAGGGPVAGLAAGVRLVPAGVPRVAVLSADLPFLTPTVLRGLSSGLDEGADVAVLVDDAGRSQWLCAVWDRAALAARLAAIGEPHGRPMRQLIDGVAVHPVSVTKSGPPPWFDCDTEEDFRRAEELA